MRLFVITLFFSVYLMSNAQNTYLHCGKLVDVEQKKVLNEMTVVIRDNQIISVTKGFQNPSSANDQIIDLKDKTVLPGLIDMHVHLESEQSASTYLDKFTMNEADVAFETAKNAMTTLMAGFTTVRDLGGSGVNTALRNAIDKGVAEGPRIYSCGKAIGTTGGHADPSNG
ncbi:MAG: amidohydrolase family protein, partial [Lutimonas sp.]